MNYIFRILIFKLFASNKSYSFAVLFVFILVTNICINYTIANAQKIESAKKTFSISDVEKVRKLMEAVKLHESDVAMDESIKKEIQLFYTNHQINDKVANKLNSLLLTVFDNKESVSNRLLVCDFLIYNYNESRDFFPVAVLEKYRIILLTIQSK